MQRGRAGRPSGSSFVEWLRMQRTLREHLDYLEHRIETLKKELYEPDQSLSALNDIAIDIGMPLRLQLTRTGPR